MAGRGLGIEHVVWFVVDDWYSFASFTLVPCHWAEWRFSNRSDMPLTSDNIRLERLVSVFPVELWWTIRDFSWKQWWSFNPFGFDYVAFGLVGNRYALWYLIGFFNRMMRNGSTFMSILSYTNGRLHMIFQTIWIISRPFYFWCFISLILQKCVFFSVRFFSTEFHASR